MAWRSRLRLPLLLLVALLGGFEFEHPAFRFSAPRGLLTGPEGDVEFSLRVHPRAHTSDLLILVDGQPVPRGSWVRSRRNRVTGVLEGPFGPGVHEVVARFEVRFFRHFELSLRARDSFEVVHLERPETCEILNQQECLFPYPSARYLEAAETPTGWLLALPEEAMPRISLGGNLLNLLPGGLRLPLDPTPYNTHDGFSPTVQVLMHFPGGVDVAGSDAPRLLPETRTFDQRSLDRDSPTVLLDADTGKRVVHFIENDVRATPEFRGTDEYLAGQATILRPGISLVPGHRYIVAVRNLVHADGTPVEAEPAFAALRDRRRTDVEAILARREAMEDVFRRLRRTGVRRDELVLAFDFVVSSDAALTREMLSMRDQAFAWLAAGGGGFTVDEVEVVNPDCADPNRAVWKQVVGSFEVPLFLDSDNIADPDPVGFLVEDAAGEPSSSASSQPPYGIAIPCAALERGPLSPLLVGHGLFGNGPGTVESLTGAEDLSGFEFIAGATNWSGLSSPDIAPLPDVSGGLDEILNDPALLAQLAAFFRSFLGRLLLDLSDFPAMADRLRQGQLNTLVLARMMSEGTFNAHPEFQTREGVGVLDTSETFYFGASLGGIMGLMFSALSPDVQNANVDVPAINFSLLLQRATPFLPFDFFLTLVEPDPNVHLLGIGLLHERWVRGESAGYARHITRDPLPGTNAKNVLMTVALYDQQVANLGSQVAGATLGLETLRGSVLSGLPLLPDRAGPLSSAYVVYDTGSFDVRNADHLPFVPPLTNSQAAPNGCDPHGRRGFIPASIAQLLAFLQPGGRIENFCTDDGICNASEPFEIPFGDAEPCNPL